jgi:short-subunit dehydrogenase
LRKKGITAVDVIIANAAINLSHPVKFIDVETDDQDETFRINVRSQPKSCFSACIPFD